MCKIEDPTKPETEDCFQWLKLADGSDKYHLPSHEDGYYRVNVKLPDGLTCKQCSLRWNYNTGKYFTFCNFVLSYVAKLSIILFLFQATTGASVKMVTGTKVAGHKRLLDLVLTLLLNNCFLLHYCAIVLMITII